MIKGRSCQPFYRIKMMIRLISLISLTVVLLPKQACALTATADDERAIWKLWQIHEAAPDDHKAGIDACQKFRKAHPGNPFMVVADTIGSWHLMKLNRADLALPLLEPYIKKSSNAFERSAQVACAAWLMRIDVERIEQALQFYYRREIAYPQTLNELAAYKALPKKMTFPMKDRGGNSWDYTLVGYSSMPDLRNQKYSLTSGRLGKKYDLKKALTIPYGSQIRIRPTGVTSMFRGREQSEVEIEETPRQSAEGSETQKKRKIMVDTGIRTEGALLAYSGKYIFLVCDSYHWKVFLKPKQR